MFAIIAIIGFIFVALFVPETKGKSIKEIREYFEESSLMRQQSVRTTTSLVGCTIEPDDVEVGLTAEYNRKKCLDVAS
jgi:hypothetical protein